MPSFDFVPVKLGKLPLDIHLECGIYSKKDEDFSLLCEDVSVNEKLLDKLKRATFPGTTAYIDRKDVIKHFFDKGHFLGFDEKDVAAIRNDESPWKARKPIPIVVAPVVKSPLSPQKGSFVTDSSAKVLLDKKRVEKFKEVIEEFNVLKNETEDLIKTASETGKVDKEKSEKISKDIQTQINATEASLIISAINQIRSVDEYLHTHCMNVAMLNGLMGKWLDFDQDAQSELVETGLFHDLGKIMMSPEVIHKTKPLKPNEFDELKKHPVFSVEMLVKSGLRTESVLEGVIQHHERVNGTGYPKGLLARNICVYARITAISDTYDAMVTKRIHADSHSPFEILNEFQNGSYSELDFNYVNVFINCMVEELKGKEIIMNDGREAIVIYVNPRNLLYPMVEVDGTVITTDDKLFCARMKNILD